MIEEKHHTRGETSSCSDVATVALHGLFQRYALVNRRRNEKITKGARAAVGENLNEKNISYKFGFPYQEVKMQLYQCLIVAALFLLIPKHIAFADQTVTLGSGKSIQIIAVGPIQFSTGTSALMLKYRTAIPLSDMASLRKEANEIWDRFQIDVEHAGIQQAIVSANEPEDGGLISHSQGYNFIFEKKDGSWRLLEGDGKTPIKLDENFVKEFCDRMDWTYEHNEMNAFLLYLANNYSGTFTEGTAVPQTADRMKLAAMTYQTLKATQNYHYQRKILKIQIGDNGASAQVESQETEQGTVNGHDMNVIEHSIDIIELQGNSVVLTKTTTSLEDQSKKN